MNFINYANVMMISESTNEFCFVSFSFWFVIFLRLSSLGGVGIFKGKELMDYTAYES